MTELDLGLKIGARRLLWTMGYTTRLDVALRSIGSAATDRSRNRRSPQAFTDLDVLGINIGPGFKSESAIVDCKTSLRGSTERMFWVRGVADFFGADTSYMLREHELTGAARQLAARLGITALSSRDLTALEALHSEAADCDSEPVSWLFDRDHVAAGLSAFGDLDRRLRPLAAYRQFDYWVYGDERNLIQVIEHLRTAADHLDVRHPTHLALLLDVAWLYLLALSQAVEHVRRSNVSDPDAALQEYLLGGPLGVREKKNLADLLEGLKANGALPRTINVEPLPTYYPSLLELTVRVLMRPQVVVTALRLLEVASVALLGGHREPLSDSMEHTYDAVAAKQAADVVGFLVASASLDREFRGAARSILLGETVEHLGHPQTEQQSLLPNSDQQ